ncbi:hypothetical protein GCM10023084_53820 [Streptomyces lacrimifluminis]|uniref:Uncharacterized protein n=1 Tax=Streptomyces lacrimifluminis TaxID=1500077 RepID=A0A917NXD0_9ACTN|nr:hypothetical protein [Streptomyces lacrimifluminis]GGJ34466.1 hypothetical protein GCM10012282_34040 [Streptomyces lacrimifluminis]
MTNPLDQLYKTKLQLIAVLAVVGGIALLMLAHWSATASVPGWLTWLPLSEIGSTLFGTGLLAVFFEYVDRKHGEERTDQRIREAVRKEAPAMRDAVLDSFAFNPETLKGVASDETLDRIATNALGLRLGDQKLAQEAYADLRDQIIQSPERWRDVDVSVSLTPWEVGPVSGKGSMFVATVRWEYKVRLASNTMRFACVSDLEEYRELLRDQSVASAWMFLETSGLNAANKEAFELLQLSLDGRSQKIRRTERKGAQLYTVSLGSTAVTGEEVTIAYTYRVLVQRHGHLLYLDLPRPTKGVHVQLAYGGAGIHYVNVLDYFASPNASRIEQSPEAASVKTIDVSFDGQIFPRAGIAFVWVLDEEL